MSTNDPLPRLQELIRETLSELPKTEGNRFRRECLREADRFLAEVIEDLKDLDKPRQPIERKMAEVLKRVAYGLTEETTRPKPYLPGRRSGHQATPRRRPAQPGRPRRAGGMGQGPTEQV